MNDLTPEVLEKLASLEPTNGASLSVFGVLIAFLLVGIVVLAKTYSKVIDKLLEAKDDMKGVIREVSTCVATNTSAHSESARRQELVLAEIKSMREDLHEHQVRAAALSPHEPRRTA